MPLEKDMSTEEVKPRLKVKIFWGGMYDHTTATVTFKNPETGEMEKLEFRPYPDSHRDVVEQREAMRLKDMDESEAALKAGQATHAMQDDASDWSEMFSGFGTFLKQALTGNIELLSKEQEIEDNGLTDNLDRTTLSYSEDKIPALRELHQDIKEGKYGYSVIDGNKRAHCGTITQIVVETALKDQPEADLVKPSLLERVSTTNPCKVFERAKTASEYQRTGVLPSEELAVDLKKVASYVPHSYLRRFSYSVAQVAQPTEPRQPRQLPLQAATPQAARRVGFFGTSLLLGITDPSKPNPSSTGPKF